LNTSGDLNTSGKDGDLIYSSDVYNAYGNKNKLCLTLKTKGGDYYYNLCTVYMPDTEKANKTKAAIKELFNKMSWEYKEGSYMNAEGVYKAVKNSLTIYGIDYLEDPKVNDLYICLGEYCNHLSKCSDC
jgi:hypothetical protein